MSTESVCFAYQILSYNSLFPGTPLFIETDMLIRSMGQISESDMVSRWSDQGIAKLNTLQKELYVQEPN